MYNRTYNITLSNGYIINDLRMNGNWYISNDDISPDLFEGNLREITISNDETNIKLRNLKLIDLVNYNGECWFMLKEMTEDQIANLKNRADIDYIAMMSDIEL